MNVCEFCTNGFPSEAILARHREFEHPEEYAAALEAAAAERAEAVEDDGRYTSDGFLKRTGARREQTDYLGSLFPEPEQPIPPWERERLERERE